MTAALEGGEWSAARPGRTLPPGKDPAPILQEAGGGGARAGLDGRKISSPPRFDPGPKHFYTPFKFYIKPALVHV